MRGLRGMRRQDHAEEKLRAGRRGPDVKPGNGVDRTLGVVEAVSKDNGHALGVHMSPHTDFKGNEPLAVPSI